ncbi:MAG: hypothetical protein MJZ30_11615 [Paludibacteraceae bacterium]|nr:hypothetical protein [Paludibacteraceae bacterium]
MEQNQTKLSAARIMQFCGSQLIELSDHPEVCHSGMQMAELYIKWASQFGPIRPVNSNISDNILH